MPELLLVGGGKMGSALLSGLLRAGRYQPSQCAVVEPLASARDALVAQFPGLIAGVAPVAADSAILAVKPSDVAAACATLQPARPGRVLSVVAGITIEQLEGLLWPGAVVIRAMPNTPALLGAGAGAISPSSSASEEDAVWAESVLAAVGSVVRVPEAQLDAVTGLSGSGPAYVFLVAEAMIEAGVLAGLERGVASSLALQTVLGAARMLTESGSTPETLRASVTSPGGTTAAGLRVLEQRGVRAAFLDAVAAARERSREMGRREP